MTVTSKTRAVGALLLTTFCLTANASEGRIEISAPRPLAEPLASGSYVLINDIAITTRGFRILDSNVKLDLNGFTIYQTGPAQQVDAIFIGPFASNIEITNGTIRDFPKYGIYATGAPAGSPRIPINLRLYNLRIANNGAGRDDFLTAGVSVGRSDVLVESCLVVNNRGFGLVVGHIDASGLLRNSVIADNRDAGLFVPGKPRFGYTTNVFNNNGISSGVPTDVVTDVGAINLGGNLCSGGDCPSDNAGPT